MMRGNRRGQVSVEAALLWTFVIAGLVFMGFYLQRAAQGGVKSNADGLGGQFSAIASYSSFSQSKTHEDATDTKQTSCAEFRQEVGDGVNVITGITTVTNCVAAAP